MIKRKLDYFLILITFALVLSVLVALYFDRMDKAKTMTRVMVSMSPKAAQAEETTGRSTVRETEIDRSQVEATEATATRPTQTRPTTIPITLPRSTAATTPAPATQAPMPQPLAQPAAQVVTEVATDVIFFDTEYRETADLPEGEQELMQQGVNGELEIAYQNTYLDGQLIDQVELSRTQIKAPVTHIILIGTAQPVLPPAVGQAPDTEGNVDSEVEKLKRLYQEAGMLPQAEVPQPEPPQSETPEISQGDQPAVPQQAGSYGFQSPGGNAAAAYNFSIISGLLQRNGSQNYGSFVDNQDGTITVDGHTFAVEQFVGSRKTTYYDGYLCAEQTDFKWAKELNGIACNPTASGVLAQRGIVSVDANSGIPFGTVFFIEGYGLAVAGDYGNFAGAGVYLDLAVDPQEATSGMFATGNHNVYILATP